MELRTYQIAGVEMLRAEFRKGAQRVLAVAPTGSGKTVLFCHIVQQAVLRGSRALVLAHRRELITQTSDKLRRFGLPHGLIQAGRPLALHEAVQVASVQTIIRRPDILSRVDLLVTDECHHVTEENSYGQLFARWPNAKVLGVTATPWRLDGRGLADVFPAHVVLTTPRELRDLGFLCPVGGWEYEAVDTSGARVREGDFVAKDLAESASSRRVVGDVVTEWCLHANGARTVLFALDVAHSKLMARAFCDAGVAAEHLDGKMPALERDAVLARFERGQTVVLTNCNVLSEGWDLPAVEVCILCRPTLSTALALQMVGRVLRPSPGKERARIHDHAGVLAAHGHPYMERDYSPEVTARVGREAVEEEDAERERRCPACKSAIARWPCDSCGYHPTPQELQLQYTVEEARRRAIENEPTERVPRTQDEADRQERWRTTFEPNEGLRRGVFRKWAREKGLTKAVRTYRFFSGYLAHPDPEWVAEARADEAGKAATG